MNLIESRTSGRTRKKGKGRHSGGTSVDEVMLKREYDEKENTDVPVDQVVMDNALGMVGTVRYAIQNVLRVHLAIASSSMTRKDISLFPVLMFCF